MIYIICGYAFMVLVMFFYIGSRFIDKIKSGDGSILAVSLLAILWPVVLVVILLRKIFG